MYPKEGVSLPTASCMAPNAAVVVRAPAVHPKERAGWNLNTYLARISPNNRGHCGVAGFNDCISNMQYA